ncbi:MAG: phosphate ABC transporter permease PstC, partial [Ferrovum sp.]|nr:phosphate ABC transporter permease PstC [Ferrovum sp.]
MSPPQVHSVERTSGQGGKVRVVASLGDRFFEWLTRGFALLVLLTLGGILLSLVVTSAPSIKAFGLPFLWSDDWDPVRDQYGALIPVYGTLVSSLVALLIAVPVSFGIAIFLTEMSPNWLKRPLGTAIELLAAIPSIIYGMWGLFSFAPVFSKTFQPFLISTLGQLPFVGPLFQGPPLGIGMLTAGIILAIMVIPFISSVMRDVFELVPAV